MAFDGTLDKDPNGGTARKTPVVASVYDTAARRAEMVSKRSSSQSDTRATVSNYCTTIEMDGLRGTYLLMQPLIREREMELPIL